MSPLSSYLAFLQAKIPQAEIAGFEPMSPPHPSLLPHQVDVATWAVRGGRRALFEAFGLGKSRQNLQIGKWIAEKTGGKYLIVCPLGVRHQFIDEDGPAMGIPVHFVRTSAEVEAIAGRIFCTNYESVREGKIDVSLFTGIGLDEASVLRSYGSKTYQTFTDICKAVPYRFVFTATPSPNRYKELIHYAGFLGIMDTGEALTRFFQRDSEQANNLTLYPHMEVQFWHWMMSWACFLTKPSDLGYSDEGYDLPPIQIHWHRLEVNHREAWSQVDSWGQAQLLRDDAQGLRESAEIKRESIDLRVQKAKELIGGNSFSGAEVLRVFEGSNGEETKAFYAKLEAMGPAGIVAMNLFRAQKCSSRAKEYRKRSHKDDAYARKQWSMDNLCVALSEHAEALQIVWGWKEDPAQEFHNQVLYVELPTGQASFHTAARGQGPDFLGEWDGVKGRSEISILRYTTSLVSNEHWIIWHDLEKERETIEAEIPEARTVYGSQDLEDREKLILGFGRGEYRILATKPIIAGSGCNFQRHCHNAIFLGVGYKFNDFIQAIHRIYRFLQKHQVHIHIIHLDSEDAIVAELKAKWKRHDELMARMSELLRQYKLTVTHNMELLRSLHSPETRLEVKGSRFRAIWNDTVMELLTEGSIADNSVDHICTSIPFGNQYEYSPTFNDFGHNPHDTAFFEQMDHLCPQLLRVLKPGRIAAIHVKDRIRFGNVTGYACPTVDPFSDKTTQAFLKAGFVLMARITIDTDVVRENAQTYRLGWSENAKDSSKMGAGMPEYVLIFRKLPTDLSDGYADDPVTKSKADYTRADWQLDAAGLWRSDGDRLPDPEILRSWSLEDIKRWWTQHCLSHGYSYDDHVTLAKALEVRGKLPSGFMLFPPISRNADIWTDIARMRTLNSEQSKRNKENHVCPLQLDIIRRLITRYTNPGDLVFDPFGGIGSVPYQALKMGRHALMTELNQDYWHCAVGYCEMAEAEMTAPTLFDLSALTPSTPVPASLSA